MSAGALFDVAVAALRQLDDRPADALVLAYHADERPLTGLAGLADWRLRGVISRWLRTGFATGELGEHVLYPVAGRLPQRLVLAVGLGRRSEHRTDRATAAAEGAAQAAVALGARRLVCGLFGLEHIPTPLSRSLPELLAALRSIDGLEGVTFAVPPDLAEVIQGIGLR